MGCNVWVEGPRSVCVCMCGGEPQRCTREGGFVQRVHEGRAGLGGWVLGCGVVVLGVMQGTCMMA